MEKKIRIYIETSVISHLDAPDRPDWMAETLVLWKSILAGQYEIVVGVPVIVELKKCNEPKRTFMFDELEKIPYTVVEETDESKFLAADRQLQGYVRC